MNPNLSIRNVNKRFYGQYLYKLEVHVNGSGFLRHPELSIEEQAEHRKKCNELRKINFGGSWRYNRTVDPSDRDVELLELIRAAQKKYPALRMRVEEPMFQIYSDNEQELYQFTNGILYGDNKHIIALHRPQSAKHLDLLQQGYTISRKSTDFPIKVHIREGRYSLQTKSQVVSYLNNMPEEAYLPKHFVDSFSKEYESVWNCYFYIKDRSILTMLALISPSLVRATEEYHIAPSADK